MRAAAWLFAAAITWFLAGLYQMKLLAVLFLVQLLLFFFMGAAALYLKHTAQVRVLMPDSPIFCGQTAQVRLRLENRGFLPPSRFQVTVLLRNALMDEEEVCVLTGSCPPEWQTEAVLPVAREKCGILTVSPLRLKVWDPMGLFRRSKKLTAEERVAVLPKTEGAAGPEPAGRNREMELTEALREAMESSGTEPEETVPYREGDPLKHIHWKLSARQEELMVKRYLPDAGDRGTILLADDIWNEKDGNRISLFVTRELSLAQGLAAAGWKLEFLWKSCRTGEWKSFLAENRDGCDTAMEQLLEELEARKMQEMDREAMGRELEEIPAGEEDVLLWLDRKGTVWADGDPVYRFEEETEEIG